LGLAHRRSAGRMADFDPKRMYSRSTAYKSEQICG
jgi:hypothetical protein